MSRFGWPCPKCGAAARQYCRTLTTGRATGAHRDRLAAMPQF